jgi:hypothetical protein
MTVFDKYLSVVVAGVLLFSFSIATHAATHTYTGNANLTDSDPSGNGDNTGLRNTTDGPDLANTDPIDWQFKYLGFSDSAEYCAYSALGHDDKCNDLMKFKIEAESSKVPVPLPAALPLFSAALAGLIVAARRRVHAFS